MIIEGKEIENNKKYYYLLGHLNQYAEGIKQESMVFPEMVVGYVGNTGNCRTGSDNHPVTSEERIAGKGAHLHLSVFITSDVKQFYNKFSNSFFKDFHSSICVNPFKHTEFRII